MKPRLYYQTVHKNTPSATHPLPTIKDTAHRYLGSWSIREHYLSRVSNSQTHSNDGIKRNDSSRVGLYRTHSADKIFLARNTKWRDKIVRRIYITFFITILIFIEQNSLPVNELFVSTLDLTNYIH